MVLLPPEVRRQWGIGKEDRKKNIFEEKNKGGGKMKCQGERDISVREEKPCKRCMCKKLVKDYWV